MKNELNSHENKVKQIDGLNISSEYVERDELRYAIYGEVTCVKREDDWFKEIQVGDTFLVSYYAPKIGKIALNFGQAIGWYPITHFDYPDKPEHLKIPIDSDEEVIQIKKSDAVVFLKELENLTHHCEFDKQTIRKLMDTLKG